MKKTLALILVLALAVILCVSCGPKPEEQKTEKTEGVVNYTIYNRTGETVTKLTIIDRNTENETTVGSIPDGDKYSLSMTVVLENGSPNLQFSFETKGSMYGGSIDKKDVPITLLPASTEGDRVSYTEPKD